MRVIRWCINRCLLVLLLTACSHTQIVVPPEFRMQQLDTGDFVLAAWQKERSYTAPVKIYIEGEGASFNAYGQPTTDPTPKGTLLREIAFGDPSPNVVYLARPCQFYMDGRCRQKYWTTARFAPEVIDSMYRAIKQVAQGRKVILIGFSGGAQVAGLVAATKSDIDVKQVITIGGNLDHKAWTDYHRLPPLSESLNLKDYIKEFCTIPQKHFVGANDDIMSTILGLQFIQQCSLDTTEIADVVGGATHTSGWETIYPFVWEIR